ncbi:hypothetical protein [Cobetia sp. 1CM21F]|uniref:capsular polysaccharide export protein, LipB/KpsS family n=1 Tax=Cobetia sp. 1CM21F TaxID=2929163 RepID=UPI0020BDB30C|nr:hypothetical protein [Cobetia sp. 1CM21F]MCK8066949.1 hypothetical protein [Cobetia sp. 1CM21F]
MRFLFSDNLHFHKRNFKSLIEYVESNASEIFYNDECLDWCSLKGNYTDKKDQLKNIYDTYEMLSPEVLYSLSHRKINLYATCRAELLCYISTKDDFEIFSNDYDMQEEFTWIYEHFLEDLLLNMSATRFWIDQWENKLDKLPVIHKVIVFSGSTIYSKVLLEIFKRKQGDAFVAESFFTGNEYYLERKNTHLPNNSDVKFKNYLSKLDFDNIDLFERERIKAHNKIRMSKNKNVVQPEFQNINILNGEGYFLIIGQVVNDFSVLENVKGVRNTLSFYTTLIESLLENTEVKIVFKAHPWERHNANLKRPKTYTHLTEWASKLSDNNKKRIFITENYNLNELLSGAEYIATLCSQASLEAAYQGFKPIQFGNAFYGNHGFTTDYENVEELVSDLNDQKVHGKLSIDEFYAYEVFMTKVLQKHLISVHKSGHLRLREIFSSHDQIKMVQYKAAPISHKLMSAVDKNEFSNHGLTLAQRRLRKLKKSPKQYFKDSRYSLLRPLHYFFKM